jgi:hypothetical protein
VAAEKRSPNPLAAPDAEAPDSRSTVRRSCVQFVWYWNVEDGTKRGLARTVDISAAGLGLVTTHTVARGERFFVVVVTRFGRVALLGKVMHVREPEPGTYRAGLQIEIIPPTDRSTWHRLLREEPR